MGYNLVCTEDRENNPRAKSSKDIKLEPGVLCPQKKPIEFRHEHMIKVTYFCEN